MCENGIDCFQSLRLPRDNTFIQLSHERRHEDMNPAGHGTFRQYDELQLDVISKYILSDVSRLSTSGKRRLRVFRCI